MIARTTWGRSLVWALALAVSQVTAPLAWSAVPHLVDSQQVQARLAQDAAARAERVTALQSVLDSSEARKQAGVMGLNVGKLRAAVPHLSDAELRDLHGRTRLTKDVAAGHGDMDGLAIVGVVLLLAGLVVLVALEDGYYDDCGCYY